jgi:hypothetical protein
MFKIHLKLLNFFYLLFINYIATINSQLTGWILLFYQKLLLIAMTNFPEKPDISH